jgi:cytochrome c5
MGKRRILFFVACNFVLWMSAAAESSGRAVQIAANAPSERAAQIEKGRQVVAQVCAACHTTIVRMVQVHKQTQEQWKDTVYFMISRGAQIMPDEIEPVTAYLASTAGSNPQGNPTAGRGRGNNGGSGQAGEADGATILQRNCQQCHEAAVASKKPDSEDWSAVITRMMTYGARLTPEDRQKLIEYLSGR